MTYRSLMVFLDLHHTNESALRVACDLGDRFDSKVIGVTSGIPSTPVHLNGLIAPNVLEANYEQLNEAVSLCEDRFRRAADPVGGSSEWRSGTDLPADFLASEARAADLLIAGQLDPDAALVSGQSLDIGDALMKAGRPLLVVPPHKTCMPLDRIMIAWKETAEARRAISAALPLLQAAKELTIVEVFEKAEQDSAALHVADVAKWLRRHEIAASTSTELSVGNSGSQLELIASEYGADVIVAGAYGYSRFREWAFGGVTRHLLQQRSICALLMH